MKGLLKSNYLAVRSNAKVLSFFMLFLGIFVVAVISRPLLTGYMLLGIIGFSVNSIAGIRKEYASKWGTYKLTTPVRKSDIIKSYFISQLIWLSTGILFAGIGMSLSWLLHGCPFDRGIDALSTFALGTGISFFTGGFFFPLFYLGGEERCEILLVISLLCAVGISLVITSVIRLFLTPGLTAIVSEAVILLMCSLLAFVLSYPLTVGIFKKKEY